MKARVTLVAGSLLVLCLAGAILTLTCLDEVRSHATLEEVLYISSPQTLKKLSLGYNGLLADIYWTRAVQYFGGHHAEGAASYRLLSPLLNITTTLDPQLLVAYEYGSNFLTAQPPNGAGEPQNAIALVKKGIAANPNEWKLYYDLGFIYYLDMKDYPQSAEAFAKAAAFPDAHPFTKVLAATVAQRGGDAKLAQVLWTTTYESTTDKDIKANAAAHLRALQVDQEVGALETIVARYEQQTGHLPHSFEEMAQAGFTPGIPQDPLGHPYKITPDGRVELRTPDDFPFVTQGLPLGYVAPLKPKLVPEN